MRHNVLIVLLTLGTLVGFGTGFSHMHHRRQAFIDAQGEHFAQLCTEAAKRACEPAAPRPLVQSLPTEP